MAAVEKMTAVDHLEDEEKFVGVEHGSAESDKAVLGGKLLCV